MRLAIVLLASVLSLTWWVPAFATDLDKFQKRVERSAPHEPVSSPPVVCVCTDSAAPETYHKTGQLYSSAVPNATGNLSFLVS